MRGTEYTSPVEMSAEDLKAFMEAHNEKDYRLIDVRQPAEYRHEHLPGSILLPLLELESSLFDLPADQDLIFYCANGARSVAAATLALDAEVTRRRVYNLAGGIMNWYGRTLSDFPKVRIFDAGEGITDLLHTAMDLEKGAWRFYAAVAGRHEAEPFAKTFATLSQAENAHAAAIYTIWAAHATDPPPFDELFDALAGDILEGGETLETALEQMNSLSGEPCLSLIELALRIEYSAFDLYRTTASHTPDLEVRDMMLSIAQAEKAHMRGLIRAIDACPNQTAPQ
ncbi:MAG: rhodanese-like domain-containing protein [Desulfobacterales bacterium]